MSKFKAVTPPTKKRRQAARHEELDELAAELRAKPDVFLWDGRTFGGAAIPKDSGALNESFRVRGYLAKHHDMKGKVAVRIYRANEDGVVDETGKWIVVYAFCPDGVKRGG